MKRNTPQATFFTSKIKKSSDKRRIKININTVRD